AVFSFGDELLHAGETAREGSRFDAASPMLQALLSAQRIESLAWPALSPARIEAALGDAIDSFDLVAITATDGAAAALRERLPRWGVPMPEGGEGAPSAWRSSRARVVWLSAEPERLDAQFHGWVVPLLDALQYGSGE